MNLTKINKKKKPCRARFTEPQGYYKSVFYDMRNHDRRVTLTRISLSPETYSIEDTAGILTGEVLMEDLPYFMVDHEYLMILKVEEELK